MALSDTFRYHCVYSIPQVMERSRDGEDGLRWYCKLAPQDIPLATTNTAAGAQEAHAEGCKHVVYERHFPCKDLVGQLKVAISEYYESEEKRTCVCGRVDQKPQRPLEVPEKITDDGPVSAGKGDFGQWGMGAARIGEGLRVPRSFDEWVKQDGTEGERLKVVRVGDGYNGCVSGETLVYAGQGSVKLRLSAELVGLEEGEFILVPPQTGLQVEGSGRVVLITAIE